MQSASATSVLCRPPLYVDQFVSEDLGLIFQKKKTCITFKTGLITHILSKAVFTDTKLLKDFVDQINPDFAPACILCNDLALNLFNQN